MAPETLAKIRRSLAEAGWGGVETLSAPGVLMLVSALPDTEEARLALEAAFPADLPEPKPEAVEAPRPAI